MTDDRTHWHDLLRLDAFPWLNLLRALRVAVSPQLVVLAALGIVVTSLGWRFFGYVFSGDAELKRLIELNPAWPWEGRLPTPTFHWNSALALATATWSWFSHPFEILFRPDVSITRFIYSLLCGLWAVAVWALVGGAIARTAALALARDDRVGVKKAILFAASKWLDLVGAALLPIVGVLLTAIPLTLLGLFFRFDVGVLLAAVFWPLALVAGLFMSILVVGLGFGWPLMWATIGTEGTDSFDAVSRSYSYVYQRPLYYLFCVLVAAVLGLLGWLAVSLFAGWTLQLAAWGASWGSGAENMDRVLRASIDPSAESGAFGLGARIIGFWNGCVMALAVGFVFSYFWTAATAIYFLLRRSADGTEMDEAAIEEADATFGLPPLKEGDRGVPEVDDRPPAASGLADTLPSEQ